MLGLSCLLLNFKHQLLEKTHLNGTRFNLKKLEIKVNTKEVHDLICT